MANNRKAKATLKRLQAINSASGRNVKKYDFLKFRSLALDQALLRGRNSDVTNKSAKRKELPTPGLGYAASHEGMTVGHTVVAGHIVNYVSSACSCGGENPNCFRCDGTGFYVLERIGNEVSAAVSGKRKAGKSRGRTLPTETSFSNDTRGGSYAIRENGRFGSGPVHDDYDDESTS
jgi:hypothetical protein